MTTTKTNKTVNYKKINEDLPASALNVQEYLKDKTVTELREITQRDRLPYSIMLLNVSGDLNIGSSIRSAHLLGAKEVILFGRHKYDKRSTVGAENYVPTTIVDGLKSDGVTLDADKFHEYIWQRSIYPFFVETDGSLDINEFNWKEEIDGQKKHNNRDVCFVFGHESNIGIPNNFIFRKHDGKTSQAGMIVSVPTCGVLRSLNVAATVSIVCYELYRQFAGTKMATAPFAVAAKV